MRRWSLTGLVLLIVAVIIVASPWVSLWIRWLSQVKVDGYIIASTVMSILIGVGGLFGGLGAFKERLKYSMIGGGICLAAMLFYRIFMAYLGAWRGVDIWLIMAGGFMFADRFVSDRLRALLLWRRERRVKEVKPKDPFEGFLEQLKGLEEELEGLWRNPAEAEMLEAKLSEARKVRAELLKMAEGRPDLLARLRREAYRTKSLQRLLEVFLSHEAQSLEPIVEEGNIVYKPAEEALDVNPRYVLELLERLAELEILVKRFNDKVLNCPKCGYFSEIIMHYKCPKCASRDIDMIKLLEHLTCGTVHEKSRYLKGDRYICPKCKVEVTPDTLRVVGVTYKCNSCDETFSDPLEFVYCKNCGSEFSLKEGEFTNTYTYTLNLKLKEEIITTIYISALTSILTKEGFKIETPAILKGKAQLPLDFSIAAEKGELRLVMDLIHSDKEVKLHDILPSVAKFNDLEYAKSILVAIPKISGEAIEFLESKEINYITGQELEEVKIKLRGLLQALGRESKHEH